MRSSWASGHSVFLSFSPSLRPTFLCGHVAPRQALPHGGKSVVRQHPSDIICFASCGRNLAVISQTLKDETDWPGPGHPFFSARQQWDTVRPWKDQGPLPEVEREAGTQESPAPLDIPFCPPDLPSALLSAGRLISMDYITRPPFFSALFILFFFFFTALIQYNLHALKVYNSMILSKFIAS